MYKLLHSIIGVLFILTNLFGQTNASLPIQFQNKLEKANIHFYLSGKIEDNSLKRSAISDKCEFKLNYEPDLVISKNITKKKEIEIWYKIDNLDTKANKQKLPRDFLNTIFSTNSREISEQDEEIPVDSEILNHIHELQHADWAKIATFVVNDNIHKCLKETYCTMITMYKDHLGYASMFIFYSEEDMIELDLQIKDILATFQFVAQ